MTKTAARKNEKQLVKLDPKALKTALDMLESPGTKPGTRTRNAEKVRAHIAGLEEALAAKIAEFPSPNGQLEKDYLYLKDTVMPDLVDDLKAARGFRTMRKRERDEARKEVARLEVVEKRNDQLEAVFIRCKSLLNGGRISRASLRDVLANGISPDDPASTTSFAEKLPKIITEPERVSVDIDNEGEEPDEPFVKDTPDTKGLALPSVTIGDVHSAGDSALGRQQVLAIIKRAESEKKGKLTGPEFFKLINVEVTPRARAAVRALARAPKDARPEDVNAKFKELVTLAALKKPSQFILDPKDYEAIGDALAGMNETGESKLKQLSVPIIEVAKQRAGKVTSVKVDKVKTGKTPAPKVTGTENAVKASKSQAGRRAE